MNETKTKKREWVKTAAIIFLALMLVLTFFSNTILNASLPEVATQQVESGTINAKIRGNAPVSANEAYEVTISQTRKVGSVLCKVGKTVEVGDTLFILEADDSDELKQAQELLADMELSYQKSLLAASNEDATDNRQVQKARDAYNEALQVYNMYSSMDPMQLAAAQAKAKNDLKTLQRTLEDIQEEYSEAQQDEDYLRYKAKIEETEPQIEELNEQIKALKKANSNKAEAVAKLENEIQELNRELSAAQSQISEADRKENIQRNITEEKTKLDNACQNEYYLALRDEIAEGDVFRMQQYADFYDKDGADGPYVPGGVEGLLEQHLIFKGLATVANASDVADKYIKAYEKVEACKAAIEHYETKLQNLTDETDEEVARIERELEAKQNELSFITGEEDIPAKIQLLQDQIQSLMGSDYALKQNYVETQEKKIDRLKERVRDAEDAVEEQQDYIEKLMNAESAAATVRSCKEALEDLLFQQSLSDDSYLDLQAAKVDIEKQKEVIDNLTKEADGVEVTAKVSGVIASINVTAGNTVGAEMPLCTINVADRGYTVKIPVSADQAKKVKVGDSADVVNYWGGDIEAILENITPDPANPSTGRLLVFKLTGEVEPGTNLTLSIGQKSANFDTLVPNSAIRTDNNGTFVLVLVAKSTPLSTRYTAKRAEVQILAEDDTYTAVSGLSYGDFVITTSTKPIEAGTQVRLADNG